MIPVMTTESSLTIINVRGGFEGRERQHAKAGELRWTRACEESETEFRERAIAAANEHKAPILIFGGLPE
jgi:hypothetical protein